ncbi:hypothetical protein Q9R32_05840 [Actinotalea sp. AC32]|nr:hypothetical protein [Actinotalea sp. AC32]
MSATERARRRLGPGLLAFLVVDVVLVLGFLVLLATALGDDDDPAAQPSPSASAEPESTPSDSDADAEDVGEVRTFVLPSGNIHCTMDEGSATCTILSSSFEPPATPEGCAGAVGSTLTVAAGESAGFVCVEGDPPAAPEDAVVLEYGEQSTVGEMTCASSRNGVLCRHNPSGEGFSVARAGYLLF